MYLGDVRYRIDRCYEKMSTLNKQFDKAQKSGDDFHIMLELVKVRMAVHAVKDELEHLSLALTKVLD